MSKLFKNFFIFALALLVVAFQVEAGPAIFWDSATGLNDKTGTAITFDAGKFKFGTPEQYVVLKEHGGSIYQGLDADVNKGTVFVFTITGTWETTIAGASKPLVFAGSGAIEKADTTLVNAPIAPTAIFWDSAKGLNTASGDAITLDSGKFKFGTPEQYVVLKEHGGSIYQGSSTDANKGTVFVFTITGTWETTIAGASKPLVFAASGAIEKADTVTVNAPIAPTAIFWNPATGLNTASGDVITLVGDKFQHTNGKYVVLKEHGGSIYQGLDADVNKGTVFVFTITGTWETTIAGASAALVFDGTTKVITHVGTVTVKPLGVPELNIVWGANGLEIDSNTTAIAAMSVNIDVGNGKFLKLDVSGTNVSQTVVDVGDATKFIVDLDEVKFDISGKTYTLVKSTAGVLAIKEGTNDLTLIPYVAPVARDLYWKDGLSFDSTGDKLELDTVNKFIKVGANYLVLTLHGTEFNQTLATTGTVINQDLGKWTFTENSAVYTLADDGTGKILAQGATNNYTINAYNGPTLYWNYNLTLNYTKDAAKYSPATGRICFNSSSCLVLVKNNSEIKQSLDLSSAATNFTQILGSSEWQFMSGTETFSIKQNTTSPEFVVITDSAGNEIKVAAYSGPQPGSSSIVTPLFCTIFVTLAVAIFAL